MIQMFAQSIDFVASPTDINAMIQSLEKYVKNGCLKEVQKMNVSQSTVKSALSFFK